MKFAKKYETYMKGMEEELPGVGLKRLKKMLKKCRSELRSHEEETGSSADAGGRCPGHCSALQSLIVSRNRPPAFKFLNKNSRKFHLLGKMSNL